MVKNQPAVYLRCLPASPSYFLSQSLSDPTLPLSDCSSTDNIVLLDLPGPAYLPEPVSTMIPEAKLLKEASTAPIAIASAGSLQCGVERRRSSNTCRWNMAASASRAIWHKWGQDASSKGIPTPSAHTDVKWGKWEEKKKGRKMGTERDNVGKKQEERKLKERQEGQWRQEFRCAVSVGKQGSLNTDGYPRVKILP